jgi:hypothetical protein
MAFEAKYGGVCEACEERIRPGERVTYDVHDDLVHASCAGAGVSRSVRREAAEVVCETCWLVKPCECEEAS